MWVDGWLGCGSELMKESSLDDGRGGDGGGGLETFSGGAWR